MNLTMLEQAPPYLVVMERIRKSISEGEWIPGSKIPSVRKLAGLYGVSQATVSHACASLIREGVLRSERGRGMFVMEADQRALLPVGLFGHVSKAFLNKQVERGFIGNFFVGLQEALARHERRLMVMGDIRSDRFKPEDLHQLGGAVIFQNFSVDEIVGFKRFGLPFVVADLDMSLANVDSVATDNSGGMAKVVQELAARGARKLVYLHSERAGQRRWDPALDERLEGFRLAAQVLGLEAEVMVRTRADGLNTSGKRAAEELLKREALPDALVCFGDEPAQGALQVFTARGVSVPESIQITGFGDVPRGDTGAHELATIRFDSSILGQKAMDLLIRRQTDPAAVVRLERVQAQWRPGTTTRTLT